MDGLRPHLEARDALDSAADFASLKAPGTNVPAGNSPIPVNLNPLQVGIPATTGLSIGVGYVIAGGSTLIAYDTASGHTLAPPCFT